VKKNHLLISVLLMIAVTVAFAGLAPAQAPGGAKAPASAKKAPAAAKKAPAAAKKPLITVLNPAVESKMVDRVPLPPRLNTLEGKTIYLVDINWGGPEAAYSVFEEIQSWLAQNMPSVKIIIKRKYGSYSNDDPALWKEIAKNGNAALIGISG
jgi:hypothetical protein